MPKQAGSLRLMRGDMGRHYSTRDFFRQMPNRLLARYFTARGWVDHVPRF